VPVLILGGGITALGALRSLGRRRIPAFVHEEERGVVAWSRWHRPFLPDRQAKYPPGELPAMLARADTPRLVLLPCADPWVEAVVRSTDRDAERFPSSLPPAETVATLVDKGKMALFLEEHAIPHPKTFLVRRPADVEGLVSSLGAGAFIKPRDSYAFQQRFGVKALRVLDAGEAAARARDAAVAGLELLVQEYVPGPPTGHCFIDGFVDRGGTVRALFARRRLRMWPPDFGNSSAMVSIALQEVAQPAGDLRRLLAASRYRGVFSAEFKQDPRDGRFKLLEVNVRPWWYVEFAERAGVNVCEMAYRDALGLPVTTVSSYSIGLQCVYPYYDRLACGDLLSRGQLSRHEWLRSWTGAHQPVFSFSDPLPAAVATGQGLARWLRRRLLL
jgi:predicted ATP-grasp superfamily ATP-dependent carboligase